MERILVDWGWKDTQRTNLRDITQMTKCNTWKSRPMNSPPHPASWSSAINWNCPLLASPFQLLCCRLPILLPLHPLNWASLFSTSSSRDSPHQCSLAAPCHWAMTLIIDPQLLSTEITSSRLLILLFNSCLSTLIDSDIISAVVAIVSPGPTYT